ncbi:MAG: polymerase subunit delta [Pseudomonadota bacterium]|jgi:DNA polymerase-3 subunit delta
MQLNLTNCLTPSSDSAVLLLSADEDYLVILTWLLEYKFSQANKQNQYIRKVFNADRYFLLSSLEDLLVNLSLFGEKNWIEIYFKTKPSVEQQKQLTKLLSLLDENNRLILICDKLDKKEQASSWVKNISQFGDSLLLTGNLRELRQWCELLIKSLGFTISQAGLDCLLEMNQNNPSALYQDIQRLSWLLAGKTEFKLEQIRNLLTDSSQYSTFNLSLAYLTGNLVQTKKILANLVVNTDQIILVLWQLGEDLRKLLRLKNELRNTSDFATITSNLKIWGDFVGAFKLANNRLSYQKILNYFNQIAQLDQIVKGITKGDPLLQLQQLVINLCQGVSARD